MTTRVAYLINQYPKVSHTFIRREIHALEAAGVAVERIAIRGWTDALTDESDENERRLTRYVLAQGGARLLLALIATLVGNPVRTVRAFALATRMGWRGHRPLAYHWVYAVEACLVTSWLKRRGATHLHAHFGTNAAEVAMLCHALGGPPFSFTVHGPEEFDSALALKLGQKIERAAFVVAVSSFGRSQLLRWVSHPHWKKIHVVHCGLEAEFFRHPPSPPPRVPRLVCVGRLCEQKGQLLLLEAVAQFVEEGTPIELVLVGDGELRQAVDSYIARRGLQACVRVTGWANSEQVRREILEARAMVLPSFAEGLPVAIMESMALRRPVVSTFIAGIPELVRHGREGWLCVAGSVPSLCTAIRACLQTTADELAQMGDAAYERVRERHSVDEQVALLVTLFGTTHAPPPAELAQPR